MNKMFSYQGKRMTTWNLFTGCNFNCTYCWARKLAEGRLKRSYPDGFIPTTHPERFNKHFKPDDFVLLTSMGDISFAPSVVEDYIVTVANRYPKTKFLLCSKDPDIFRKVKFHQPNLYLGTTIESNRRYNVSRAPVPYIRALKMKELTHPHKFLSLEPIMDFDLDILLSWIYDINPEIVEVGADNYHNNLPEPSWSKVTQLMGKLRASGITVIEKDGLERLLVSI